MSALSRDVQWKQDHRETRVKEGFDWYFRVSYARPPSASLTVEQDQLSERLSSEIR